MIRLSNALEIERALLLKRKEQGRSDRVAQGLIARIEDNIKRLEEEIKHANNTGKQRGVQEVRESTAKPSIANTALQYFEKALTRFGIVDVMYHQAILGLPTQDTAQKKENDR